MSLTLIENFILSDCRLSDLKRGLKYDGDVMGIWAVQLGQHIKVRCYDIYHDKTSFVTCSFHGIWTLEHPKCVGKYDYVIVKDLMRGNYNLENKNR